MISRAERGTARAGVLRARVRRARPGGGQVDVPRGAAGDWARARLPAQATHVLGQPAARGLCLGAGPGLSTDGVQREHLRDRDDRLRGVRVRRRTPAVIRFDPI